ncbi:MAG: hypothetical protein RSJ41_09685, partial [Clostridia bacterium]
SENTPPAAGLLDKAPAFRFHDHGRKVLGTLLCFEVLLHHEKNPVHRFSCIHDSPLNWFCASAILRVSVPDKESQDFVLHIGQAQ